MQIIYLNKENGEWKNLTSLLVISMVQCLAVSTWKIGNVFKNVYITGENPIIKLNVQLFWSNSIPRPRWSKKNQLDPLFSSNKLNIFGTHNRKIFEFNKFFFIIYGSGPRCRHKAHRERIEKSGKLESCGYLKKGRKSTRNSKKKQTIRRCTFAQQPSGKKL